MHRLGRSAKLGEPAVFVVDAGSPVLWSPGYVDVLAAPESDEPPTILLQKNETAYLGYLFPLDPKNNPAP
jgi:hypothetical protein